MNKVNIDEVGVCSFINNLNYISRIKITDYKNTDAFSESGFEHIFKGQINKKNQVAGCHSPNYYANAIGKPSGTETQIGESESFEGNVVSSEGKILYTKFPINGKGHTWFPKNWSIQKTIDAIVEVTEKGAERESGTTIIFEAKIEGFIIRVVKKTDGILTAFPLCNLAVTELIDKLIKQGKKLEDLPEIKIDNKKYETTEGNGDDKEGNDKEGEDDLDI